MNAALWGLIAALSWGLADFAARFTGRALGQVQALTGVLCVGAVIYVIPGAGELRTVLDDPGGWHLLGLSGLGIMLATLFLYIGLGWGPVSIVSPIASSYPALNLVIAFLLGARPSLLQWGALLLVMLGVLVVAACAKAFENGAGYAAGHVRKTVWIAVAAACCFTLGIMTGQEAGFYYGEVVTLAVGRSIGVLACLCLLAVRREGLRGPVSFWPLVVVQGALDGLAYLCLLLGGRGTDGVIAVTVASGFAVVTALLARIFLQEPVTKRQWVGIFMVAFGAAVLAGDA